MGTVLSGSRFPDAHAPGPSAESRKSDSGQPGQRPAFLQVLVHASYAEDSRPATSLNAPC